MGRPIELEIDENLKIQSENFIKKIKSCAHIKTVKHCHENDYQTIFLIF